MRLRLALVVIATLAALAACASYVDARAEAALREALARVVGPAASYQVEVSGASLDATRFERVRFVGTRIARARTPVLDRLELELRGVAIDRGEKRLTALAAASGMLQVRAADLAEHLRERGWVDDARVVLEAPDRIAISGTPRISGLPVTIREGVELRGRLVAQGAQLRLVIESVRVGTMQAPPFVRALLERTVNPLFDSTPYPLPARFDAVAVDGETIRISASGSRLAASELVTP